jgi:hypothetical protein
MTLRARSVNLSNMLVSLHEFIEIKTPARRRRFCLFTHRLSMLTAGGISINPAHMNAGYDRIAGLTARCATGAPQEKP